MTGLGTDGLGQRIGHGPVVEGSQEPALAVHRQIASRPDRRRACVTRQDRVRGGQFVDHPGDVLRMAAGPRAESRQLIETLSLPEVVLAGRLQMSLVLVWREL